MVNFIAKIKEAISFLLKICFPLVSFSMQDSDHQSTESGALIGSSDDLVTEILIRLPVSSILRFKSVSKHWQRLLSHRHFTLRYDNLSKSPGLFANTMYIPFDAENQNPRPFPTLHFCFDPHIIWIKQSCNGLLLCRALSSKSCDGTYYVLNPTTKQFAAIPTILGGPEVCKTILFMGLAFHQTNCVHYKLVCIREIDTRGEMCQIQMYSSDTGKWKISIESFFMKRSFFIKGVYWNGAIHLAPLDTNYLYFTIEGELLQTLPLPSVMSSNILLGDYSGESRGHLHLVVHSYYQNALHLIVYEMLSDHSGWFVKYDLGELPGAFPNMIISWGLNFKIIDVVRGEKEEDTFMVLTTYEKLVAYNVHDKSVKPIFDLTNCFFYGGFLNLNFYRYIESLTFF